MCGIAGFTGRQAPPEKERIIHAMADAIANRGPDGEGYYTDEAVALGHRRRSINQISGRIHQNFK